MSSPEPTRSGHLFRSTAWTVVRAAGDADAATRDRALARISSVYWRPVYRVLRMDWNASPEDAHDLTQEYFAGLLASGLDDVSSERGRFRAWVKATLRNFMLTRRRHDGAARRGGGARHLSLDDPAGPARWTASTLAPPDRGFERELMRSILARALDALRDECRREERRDVWETFDAYYVAPEEGRARPTYEELGRVRGLGLHEIKNRLAEGRARYRRLVLEMLRDGVTADEDLVSEIKEVFGS